MAVAAVAGPASPKRQEIDQLYDQHNPEKLPEVDKLVSKYGEDRLLSMVRKKYGVNSGSNSPASSPQAAAAVGLPLAPPPPAAAPQSTAALPPPAAVTSSGSNITATFTEAGFFVIPVSICYDVERHSDQFS